MRAKNKILFDKVPIEKVRGYWDSRPCNIRHSQSPLGTRQYFDEVEARKYFVEPHIPKFAEFEKWREKKVLEIGCGIGTDTISFAKAGAEVTAIDLSEKSLALARQRAKVYGLEEKIKFCCSNAEELSKFVPIKSYDLIYSFGVIHHTPHPERVIEEIKKYSKVGTIIKVMLYHRFSWPVAWILFKGGGAFWQIDKLIARYSESHNCPITYTYSRKQILKLFKDFNVISLKVEYPPSRSNFLRRLSKKSLFFRKVINPFIDFLGRPFGWHLCLTAIARQ